jgi:predicted TIM-barrel fold metal-dependent hydrolase
MALKFGVISVDDHALEPPDLWAKRMSQAKWGDRIPQVVRQADGTERWVIDRQVSTSDSLAPTGALSNDRAVEAQRWSEVPESAYDPKARLKAMDADRIDVSVLYPTAAGSSGEVIAAIKEHDLQVECARAYNDWLIDVWATASPRFVPQAVVPIASVEAAVAETTRAVKRGHKGVVMPAVPTQFHPSVPHLYLQAWDPLWAAIQDLGVPVCFHAGSAPNALFDISPTFNAAVAKAFDHVRMPANGSSIINGMVLSGILLRYPKLQTVFASSAIDYVPFSLELMDHEWDRQRMAENDNYKDRPSVVFQRQCYVTTWREKVGLRNRRYIGVDRILWQSEFPKATSTYPESSTLIENNFTDLSREEKDKILWQNAAKLYKVQF